MTSMRETCVPEQLSDPELIGEVTRLAALECKATASLVAALAELDARRLYLGQGCSSMFTYCTQVLHLRRTRSVQPHRGGARGSPFSDHRSKAHREGVPGRGCWNFHTSSHMPTAVLRRQTISNCAVPLTIGTRQSSGFSCLFERARRLARVGRGVRTDPAPSSP